MAADKPAQVATSGEAANIKSTVFRPVVRTGAGDSYFIINRKLLKTNDGFRLVTESGEKIRCK